MTPKPENPTTHAKKHVVGNGLTGMEIPAFQEEKTHSAGAIMQSI